MPDPAKPDEKNRQDDATFSGARLWITVALLVALGAFVVYLLAGADTASETLWNRQVYVFGGVEAIVFTAVGWLFGREVHRSAAESAKAEASEAKQKADAAAHESRAAHQQAAEEQAKGKAMKVAVMALAAPAGAATGKPAGAGRRTTAPSDALGAPRRSGPSGSPESNPEDDADQAGPIGEQTAPATGSAMADARHATALMRLVEDFWPEA